MAAPAPPRGGPGRAHRGAPNRHASGPSRRTPSAAAAASRAESTGAERAARCLGLVPGALLLADDDRALVPLAGEDDRIALRRPADRERHRGPAVVDHLVVVRALLSRLGGARYDLREDARGVFEPRVLLRDYEVEIGRAHV